MHSRIKLIIQKDVEYEIQMKVSSRFSHNVKSSLNPLCALWKTKNFSHINMNDGNNKEYDDGVCIMRIKEQFLVQ